MQLNESARTAEIKAFDADLERSTVPPGQNRHAHSFPHDRRLVWLEVHTSSAVQKLTEFFGSHFQRIDEQAQRYRSRRNAHNSEKILEGNSFVELA